MRTSSLKVLIVDDEPAVVHALEVLFDVHGVPALSARTPEEALAAAAREDVGVVLQDMNFGADTTSGEEGIRLFRRIRAAHPDLPVLLMTAWASLETAVQLIKEGADDYLAKPWDDDKLVVTVNNLLRMRRLQLENARLVREGQRTRAELAARAELCGLVYTSDGMHRLVTLAVSIAGSDAPVLLTGPSGSGKEKLAEIIQANSRRARGPFLRVNVGALPAELMDVELFGAEPGAYTGATQLRAGHFEAANGGTLFLDEIDALPLSGQVKLLRVVQSGEFQRLGSSRTHRADVRLLSATNHDLREAIAAGRFREDLYYRLNVVELASPALAERAEDVLPLAAHFLAEAGRERGASALRLTREAEEALLAHRWDGNVRELANRIQRAALTCAGEPITPAHLGFGSGPADVRERAAATPALGSAPDAIERARIERALLDADGIVARAAELMGLSRQALYRKMERLGIVLERRPRT